MEFPRACYRRSFFAAADGESLELVLADAGENYADQSRPGLKHLYLRAAGLFAMVQAGVECAQKDWIFVIGDHGRPLPGLLDTYRAAIAANADVELLFGGLERLSPACRRGLTRASSTTSWSIGRPLDWNRRYPVWSILWSAARRFCRPNSRRSVASSSLRIRVWLLRAGCFIAPRPLWIMSGGSRFAPRLRQVSTARGPSPAHAQAIRGGRATPARLLRDGLVAAYGFAYPPWRMMRSLRGTPQRCWVMALRVMAIGLARAAGTLWAHMAGAGNSAVAVSADLEPHSSGRVTPSPSRVGGP